MDLYHLPLVNSCLNFLSTLFLIAGFYFIKNGKKELHQKMMWSALAISAVFLTNYLIFHFNVGSVKFLGTGIIRPIYFAILIPHIILAMAIVPLVLMTFSRAIKKNFELHKRIARITWPLWMFVSVTGVVIYVIMNAYGSYDYLIK